MIEQPRSLDVRVRQGIDEVELMSECRRFARYLANVEPSAYQVSKYVDYHAVRPTAPRSAFDRRLLNFARSGPIGLRLADAYSGAFFRSGRLRAKLILTLAVLESASPTYRVFQTADGPGLRTMAQLLFRSAVALGLLAISVLCLAPAHLLSYHAPTQRD